MNLTIFCDEDADDIRRQLIRKPFVWNGWRYATNGMIGIRERVNGIANTVPPPTGLTPERVRTELFAHFRPGRCTESFPYCPDCCGVGDVTCPMCGQERICPGCNGFGHRLIIQRTNQGYDYVMLGKCKFLSSLLHLLMALPDLRYKPCQPGGRLWFVDSDGRQIVMTTMEKVGETDD